MKIQNLKKYIVNNGIPFRQGSFDKVESVQIRIATTCLQSKLRVPKVPLFSSQGGRAASIMLYNMMCGFVPGAACPTIMFCPDERSRGHDPKLSMWPIGFIADLFSVTGWSMVGTPSRKKR